MRARPILSWFCKSSPTLAESTVAEVVDVVGCSDVVGKSSEVVDGRKNIFSCDVLRAKLCNALLSFRTDALSLVAAAVFDDFLENVKTALFRNARVVEVVAEDVFGVDRTV